jgi:regulator of sigma E protease
MGPASNPGDLDHVPPELRDRVFQLRPVWQRFLVVLAGPAANFLLAILIYAAFFTFFSVPNPSNEVGSVQRHTAAEAAGLRAGDRILSVAGKTAGDFNDIRTIVETVPGKDVTIVFARDGEMLSRSVRIGTQELKDVSGKPLKFGFLGVGPERASVIEALPMAVTYTGKITVMMVEGIARLITGGGSREEVGGPIKIAQIAGQAASLGVFAFANLLALFSINLGFINLLPVPLLDGGHLFLYTVEAVWRRPLSARALDWAFRGGLAVSLALLVFTTINDLGSVGLWDRLQRLIG